MQHSFAAMGAEPCNKSRAIEHFFLEQLTRVFAVLIYFSKVYVTYCTGKVKTEEKWHHLFVPHLIVFRFSVRHACILYENEMFNGDQIQ